MGLPISRVNLPKEPVVLTTEQIGAINAQLSKMRHDINNNLAVLVAALDLMRYKPEAMEKWLANITEQPARITESIRAFSAEFEKLMRIERP
jgi:hypothetical protein